MKLRNLALVLSVAATGACATMMQGTTQAISINSTPASATVTVDGTPMGHTPTVLRLERKNEHLVRLELDGYQPFEMKLSKSISGWVWGNILFGGVIGVAVDGSTGAFYKLSPEAVVANMETRTASIDGKTTIQVAVVMTPDPSWEKIGQLSPE